MMKRSQLKPKKYILTWLILAQIATSTVVLAQVNFERSQDFEAMKANAKNTGKFIFIDAYTDWCGWCKVMDKNTFSNEHVANVMKGAFVSYKLEMEQDSLGKLLSMKYAVTGFPSYLIFNQEGQLHTTLVGYIEVEEWLRTLDEVLRTPTPARPAISNTILLDWPDFYRNSFGVSGKPKAPTSEEVLDYLSKNKITSEMPFIIAKRYYSWLTTDYANDVLAKREELSALFGADIVDDFSSSILQSRIRKQISVDDETALNQAVDEYLRYFPEDEAIRPRVLQSFYLKHKKYNELVALVEANYDTYSTSALNSICWELYTGCDDQVVLKKAVLWMENVVAKEPTYAYLDTFAALLYKTEAYTEAEIWAKKAIEKGKSENEKVEDTEKLLKKIQSASK